MNIGKKLYLSFGIILATVLVLLAINLIAVQREHETKAAAQRSIDMTEATSSVRFQMMQNRLHLQNYLLSGDTRDVEKMNDGEHQLSDALHHAQELANSAQQRSSLEKVQGLEQAWGNDFANPLVDKRRAVDSGNATVAELQIFYLQKDPNSWVSRSSDVLDDVDRENRKLLDERRHSDELAATFTILAAVFSSLFALGLGIIIAYRTATGITGPLRPADSCGGADRPVRGSGAQHRRSRQG
jgi:methyl-accepting chemotaxis protein WspA